MDPVTIAGIALKTAETAWNVGSSLWTFVQNAKTVDASVKNLASEANSLGSACEAVNKQLIVLPGFNRDSEDSVLLSNIQSQLADCERCMSRLNKAVGGKPPTGEKNGSIFTKAVRQISFQMSKDEIGECRTQIQAYTSRLDISLHLINLKATYLAPKLANQDLLALMNKLQAAISEQGQKLDTALVQCAKEFISRGSTLYDGSIADNESVETAKVAERSPKILHWIQNLETIRVGTSKSGEPRFDTLGVLNMKEQYSRSLPAESVSIPGGVDLDNAQGVNDGEDTVLEFDDEIDIEVANSALDIGNTAFDSADYAEAESMLGGALALVNAVSSQHRKRFTLWEVHYKLALCAYYVRDTSTAETALTSLLEQPTSSDDEGIKRCHASHLLSQTYIRNSKLDLAKVTCNNAYRSRRKLLGKDSEQSYESLALLSKISTLQNDITRAKAYRNMIPEERREGLCEAIEIENVDASSKANFEKTIRDIMNKHYSALQDLPSRELGLSEFLIAVSYDILGPELLRLKKVEATLKDAYTEMDEREKYFHEKMSHMKTVFVEKITTVQKHHADEIENFQRSYADKESALEQHLNELRREYEARLHDEEKRYHNAMALRQDSFEQALERTNRDHQQMFSAMMTKHKAEIDAMKKEHEAEH